LKKDTSSLTEHLSRHPTDANAVISLLKMNSHNYEYDYNLESKRKAERGKAFHRKRRTNNVSN